MKQISLPGADLLTSLKIYNQFQIPLTTVIVAGKAAPREKGIGYLGYPSWLYVFSMQPL